MLNPKPAIASERWNLAEPGAGAGSRVGSSWRGLGVLGMVAGWVGAAAWVDDGPVVDRGVGSGRAFGQRMVRGRRGCDE
jgi:hypothetical protein